MDSPHIITLTVGLIILVCMAWVSGYIWRDTNVAVRLSSVVSCFFALVAVISSVVGLASSSH